HHADLGAQQVEVLPRLEDVRPVEQHRAFGTLMRIKLIDAVENAQQRRLAATGRSDEGGDLVLLQRHGDVLQGAVLAIEEVQLVDLDRVARLAGGSLVDGDAARPGADGGAHRAHRSTHGLFLFDTSRRAATLNTRTAAVISRAPVQASVCHLSSGPRANWLMV